MAVAVAAVSRRSPILAGGALLVALLASGCGSQPGGEGTVGSKGEPTARASTREPSSKPPTSAPPPPLTASDGTDYAACEDGTCEVAVPGPADFPVAGGTFTAKKVKAGESVEFKLTLAGGGEGSGTVKGHCGAVMKFYPGGAGMVSKVCEDGTTPSPPAPEPGMLQLQLVGWDADDAAVIRFVSSG
jgi:hypothetical protein